MDGGAFTLLIVIKNSNFGSISLEKGIFERNESLTICIWEPDLGASVRQTMTEANSRNEGGDERVLYVSLISLFAHRSRILQKKFFYSCLCGSCHYWNFLPLRSL